MPRFDDYINKLYSLIKWINFNEKLSSKKLWYDIKAEYESYQRLKDQERCLKRSFAELRVMRKDNNYNLRVEKRACQILHKQYLKQLSSVGYGHPSGDDSNMMNITRFTKESVQHNL